MENIDEYNSTVAQDQENWNLGGVFLDWLGVVLDADVARHF